MARGASVAEAPGKCEPGSSFRPKNSQFATRLVSGYTHGMKIAISIPDEVYTGAERLARRAKKSRSRLYGDALREYLARHAPDEITEALNRACAEVDEPKDPFVSAATRRILEQSEW